MKLAVFVVALIAAVVFCGCGCRQFIGAAKGSEFG